MSSRVVAVLGVRGRAGSDRGRGRCRRGCRYPGRFPVSPPARSDRDARAAVDLGSAARLRRRRVGRRRAHRGARSPRARGDAVLRPGSRSSAHVATLLGESAPRRDRALALRGRPRRSGVRRDRTRRRRRRVRRHPRPLRLHRARDGGPHRHAARPHAARPIHRRARRRSTPHGHKATLVGISRAQLAARRPGCDARHDPEPDRRRGVAAARAQGATTCSGSAG